jgi:peptide deformylase
VAYEIRTFGDPVLKTNAAPITEIDGKIARLIDEMFDTLYSSDSGIGLAAPQIGVQKQIFIWEVDDEEMVIINPEIVESSGELLFDEGCLSLPGLYAEILRPKDVLMRGLDIDGNVIELEATDLMGRLFQHEIDHLHGMLMFDRMSADQRKEALAEYSRITSNQAPARAPRRLKLK